MDNKLNNMLNEFFKNNEPKDIDEANKLLGEFMKNYNEGNVEYEETPLDKANEFLEKAYNAKSEKQALKWAKKAYETSDECFDAIIFQSNLEENPLERDSVLEEGLTYEKERLKKEGFFEKDYIGHFYGIFETRPYMRGLHTKAHNLANDGKTKQAIDVCNEILRLNKSDNTGARYLLAALYAFSEDEKELKDLYKKYTEENLEMLIPFFALYYKKGDDKKAKEYLNRIKKANPHFIEFFKGILEPFDPGEYYARGDESELMVYIKDYFFLLISMPNLKSYVLKYSK